MNLELNYSDKISKVDRLVFCDEKFNVYGLNKVFKKNEIRDISSFLNNTEIKDNEILYFNVNPTQKIIFLKINKSFSGHDIEKVGANFFEFLKKNKIFKIKIDEKNVNEHLLKNKFFLNEFLHGLFLKSYSFKKYITNNTEGLLSIFLPINLKKKINTNDLKFNSLLKGSILTKDLVSEPGNILYPEEYVKRISSLKKYGLRVKVYGEKELKKLGMKALLGVGQGSHRESYLVTIEWNGLNKKQKPLAFVGKGVCFDTGGISLKPAKFMEDMTYDMAGSAVVVGLMKTLALRKAKVNAVGVVGLVENMPDGNAQRPGDIVKSYSGKTIEILNTDAEGRLVLADALSYTEKKFKPKFIVDLATLTGAIIVSLGSEYAGLFSNNDNISDQLTKAGEKVGEKVWRMPLNDNYDKLINSKKADMQNINYVGGAGSITAAQFLQRFILNKTPWAHLDIAGMAFSKYGGALNSGGATGYGVRLLNQLIEDNYE